MVAWSERSRSRRNELDLAESSRLAGTRYIACYVDPVRALSSNGDFPDPRDHIFLLASDQLPFPVASSIKSIV